jgi:hypothetical protein
MSIQPISYLLPDGLDLDSLKAHLAENNALIEVSSTDSA